MSGDIIRFPGCTAFVGKIVSVDIFFNGLCVNIQYD
jgi:hypothetical protein